MPDIKAIQSELRANKIDGWLFYDHHHRDPIAGHVLGLDSHAMVTRRWFYFIPAKGEPRKLVHKIEQSSLDSLDGKKFLYSGWEELHKTLPKLLSGSKNIAMQYSPENNIPYIGLVDAGTVELIRKLKKKVVSSADLVQKFEASWSPAQLESHLEAGKIVDRVTRGAFQRAAAFVREGKPLAEAELQQWILDQFRAGGLTTAEPPNCCGAAQQRKSALRTESRSFAAHSRRRSVAAGYLGEIRPPAERLLRHYLGRVSRRACAGFLRQNFSHREKCSKRCDRIRQGGRREKAHQFTVGKSTA